MMGRMDTEERTCPSCKGSGRSPKKRTRGCLQCGGSGRAAWCPACKEFLPCRGEIAVGALDLAYCPGPPKERP